MRGRALVVATEGEAGGRGITDGGGLMILGGGGAMVAEATMEGGPGCFYNVLL